MDYAFKDVLACNMCGEPSGTHKILGQRLNKSQGFRPRGKLGVSVSVLICSKCKLIYSSPQPIPRSIQDHYNKPPESYWKPSYFKWDQSYFAHEINVAKEIINFKKGMAALDIGAGLGKTMLSLKNAGFETYGIEPSEAFYSMAIEKMGIPEDRLSLCMAEDAKFDQESFDFISFGAVFEHLYDPYANLVSALGWLKKGGVIQIEVPSSEWLMGKFMNLYFRLIGSNYVTNLSPMHEPFHLYEFSLNSFNRAVERAGCELIFYERSVGSIYFFPKLIHPVLKSIMKKTGTGMQLTVYLRKRI
jgi:ubiquinone/menaquinone biosynthesis C-methylase UbiE/uncharacterized protein YbaR (Trm112 family)